MAPKQLVIRMKFELPASARRAIHKDHGGTKDKEAGRTECVAWIEDTVEFRLDAIVSEYFEAKQQKREAK